MRWILAIVMAALGVAAAALAVLGGAFSTVGCLETLPDWLYYLLLGAAAILLVASGVGSVMLIRRAPGLRIVLLMLLGAILSCGGFGAYVSLLGSNCRSSPALDK